MLYAYACSSYDGCCVKRCKPSFWGNQCNVSFVTKEKIVSVYMQIQVFINSLKLHLVQFLQVLRHSIKSSIQLTTRPYQNFEEEVNWALENNTFWTTASISWAISGFAPKFILVIEQAEPLGLFHAMVWKSKERAVNLCITIEVRERLVKLFSVCSEQSLAKKSR